MAFFKLFYLRFCVSSDQLKNIVWQRFYKEFERDLYMKIIVTKIPANLITNLLSSFRRNQKQESNFHQVPDLVTRNISVFCL